jgi:DNA-binding transcriptional ArsR family regulator
MPDSQRDEYADIPVLPETAPVTMPELPARLHVTEPAQFKAIGDATRSQILTIIQQRPATAKQLADQLGIAPGTANHHLQTLEAAGLAQVVARRLIRGIVAKYYTRTARLFLFDEAPGDGAYSNFLRMLDHARQEVRDAETAQSDCSTGYSGFPHIRLTRERAVEFAERLMALADEYVDAPADPAGKVYGLIVGLYEAPPYLQSDTVKKINSNEE